MRIATVEVRQVAAQLRRIGQTAVRVLWHRAGDGDGALDQIGQRGRRAFGGGDDTLPLAHEHAQADVSALGPFQPLQRAQAPGHRQGHPVHDDRIGRIGAGPAGLSDEVIEQGQRIAFGTSHGASLSWSRDATGTQRQIGRPEPGRPQVSHFALTRSMTASVMRIFSPQSRWVSGGHLLVASRPILPPSPLSGLAKSR